MLFDRCSHFRNDTSWLENARNTNGLFVAFSGGKFGFVSGKMSLETWSQVERRAIDDPIFLGVTSTSVPLFCVRTESLAIGKRFFVFLLFFLTVHLQRSDWQNTPQLPWRFVERGYECSDERSGLDQLEGVLQILPGVWRKDAVQECWSRVKLLSVPEARVSAD